MIDQQIRKCAIGGSEVAAVLGVDNWRDPFAVWALKRGQIKPEPPNDQMMLGKLFERVIATEWYAAKTGYRVEWCDRTSVRPDRPWQAYTPDALCPDEGRGVDSKVIFWDRTGEWSDEVVPPARVELQARWYMSALDYDAWDIAAVINGEPRIYTIRRDRELEDEIERRVEEFWKRCIVGDEQPPIGISDESAAYLKQRYLRHTPRVRQATDQESALLDEYAQIRDEEEQVQNAKKLCENQLKQAVGDDSGMQNERARFTWNRTKDTIKTDWKMLAHTLMANFDDETRAKTIEEYNTVIQGIRRVYFYPFGKKENV